MEANLGLFGTSGGGGGRASFAFAGLTRGSMSTVSKEDNLVLTSEESSSYPQDSAIQLGLGLGLDGGGGGGAMRILTAKDFPSMGFKSSSKSPSSLSSSSSPSSSASSSSSMTKNNFSAGTKRRTANDSASPPANGGHSQVVGWPPIRAYRMNSLVNQAKLPATEELIHSTFEKCKSKKDVVDLTNDGSDKNSNNVKEKAQLKTSLFVKANMDGFPIGRKVNLDAHSCYETLAQTLEDMFCRPTATLVTSRSSIEEHDVMMETTGSSKLLDGSSEFVLTYEDKEGDWMLVGDVPWRMFLGSVKRLRIMRTSDANGLGSRFQEKNGRQSKPN